MDEQAAGSMTLALVSLIMLAFLAILYLPQGGPGMLLFAAIAVLATVIALVAATEGQRR